MAVAFQSDAFQTDAFDTLAQFAGQPGARASVVPAIKGDVAITDLGAVLIAVTSAISTSITVRAFGLVSAVDAITHAEAV
jgi:hypothetical protein